MLDAATLALLTKLKIFAKKSGCNIDLVKMSNDQDYAKRTLNELSNSDDSELVQIVIQLMNTFGMISVPSTQAEAKKKEEEARNEDKDRYINSLR